MRLILLASLLALASCATDPDDLSNTEQHLDPEINSVLCVPGSSTFPCMSNFDGRTFNSRFPFCLGVGPRFAKDVNGLVPPANGTGCIVGDPASAVDCRNKCGETTAPFTATCAFQFRFATGEYVGRCVSSNVP